MTFFKWLINVVFILIILTSGKAFSHAGPHESSCELMVGVEKLSLSGYQLKGKSPNRHYCRVYPQLGEISIQIEAPDTDFSQYQIEFKLLTFATWTDLITQFIDPFNQVIAHVPGKVDDSGKVTFKTEVKTIGPYLLEIIFRENEETYSSNSIMFLVGIPIAKILVGFCGLLILFLFVSMIKKSITGEQ